jgi:hypothetical protein
MEIVDILRVLGRHRVLVGLGCLLAILVALKLTFRLSLMPPGLGSREQISGIATGRVLLTAPRTPAFDLKSTNITGTLGVRSILMADLLSTDATRASIARGAGIKPDELGVITPAMGAPPVDIPFADAAVQAASVGTEPYRLTVTALGDNPIITLTVTAPDSAAAAKVVDAATGNLGRLIAASSANGPPLSYARLGPPVRQTVPSKSRKAMAVAAALVFLIMWCSAIVIVSGLRRRSRRRRGSASLRYSPST